MADERVLQKLLWFFTPAMDGEGGNDNIPSQYDSVSVGLHDITVIRTFVKEFVHFIWEFQYFDRWATMGDVAIQERFRCVRPHTVKLLYVIGDLGYLLSRDSVDEEVLEELEKILRYSLRYHFENRPFTMEEAFANGNRDAGILILLRIKQKEKSSLQAVEKAKRQREEADRMLATLSRPQ